VRDKGQALTALLIEIQTFAKGDAGNGALAGERDQLAAALEDVQSMVGGMVGFLTSAADDKREIYKVGLNSTRLLMSLGDLIIGWLLLRGAEVALAALGNSPVAKDVPFYQGKIAAAKWFAANVLPELRARRATLEATTLDLMDVPEDAF
jgi:hypothetical protein